MNDFVLERKPSTTRRGGEWKALIIGKYKPFCAMNYDTIINTYKERQLILFDNYEGAVKFIKEILNQNFAYLPNYNYRIKNIHTGERININI